jgi:hypothetical protein
MLCFLATVLVALHINKHTEQALFYDFYQTRIPRYQVILRDPWLTKHNSQVSHQLGSADNYLQLPIMPGTRVPPAWASLYGSRSRFKGPQQIRKGLV